jgi:hypothetical protein
MMSWHFSYRILYYKNISFAVAGVSTTDASEAAHGLA